MKNKQTTKKETEFLTFLKRVRAGKYCKIERGLLSQVRPEIVREESVVEGEESYYYSIR